MVKKIEDSRSKSDLEFTQFIQKCFDERDNEIMDDTQSNILVSSVHTSNLSNFNDSDNESDTVIQVIMTLMLS